MSDKLSSLHELLADVMRKRLEDGEDHVVAKTGEILKTDCSAATLREIRQFLADNKIDAERKPGTPLDKLASAAERKNVLPFPKASDA
jgi:hypothetical protein